MWQQHSPWMDRFLRTATSGTRPLIIRATYLCRPWWWCWGSTDERRCRTGIPQRAAPWRGHGTTCTPLPCCRSDTGCRRLAGTERCRGQTGGSEGKQLEPAAGCFNEAWVHRCVSQVTRPTWWYFGATAFLSPPVTERISILNLHHLNGVEPVKSEPLDLSVFHLSASSIGTNWKLHRHVKTLVKMKKIFKAVEQTWTWLLSNKYQILVF